jgi:hypothetical protein
MLVEHSFSASMPQARPLDSGDSPPIVTAIPSVSSFATRRQTLASSARG